MGLIGKWRGLRRAGLALTHCRVQRVTEAHILHEFPKSRPHNLLMFEIFLHYFPREDISGRGIVDCRVPQFVSPLAFPNPARISIFVNNLDPLLGGEFFHRVVGDITREGHRAGDARLVGLLRINFQHRTDVIFVRVDVDPVRREIDGEAVTDEGGAGGDR